MIPQEAVEAAVKAVQNETYGASYSRDLVRIALEAAAPFLRAQALEDAAQELARLPYVKPDAEGRAEYEQMLDIRRGNTDGWLLARAEKEKTLTEPTKEK